MTFHSCIYTKKEHNIHINQPVFLFIKKKQNTSSISPTYTYMDIMMWENFSAEKMTCLNYSKHSVKRLLSCAPSICMRDLVAVLPIFPRTALWDFMFFRWAWRLSPPHPTWLSAVESIFEDHLRCAAPWWLGFDDAAPSSVSTVFKRTVAREKFTPHLWLPIFNKRICTVCTVGTLHTFTIAVLAGQHCSSADTYSSSAFTNS